MARISFSSVMEEITGKLAGSVFQDSYIGFQIRTRVTPRNPQTNYQQLRRGEFAFLSASWRTLTNIQRQTFIDAAGSTPQAVRLFISLNINLILIESPLITSYVYTSVPPTFILQINSVGSNSLIIQATGILNTVPVNYMLLLFATYEKAVTKIFTNPSQYSPIASFAAGTDFSAPVDVAAYWIARYGQLGTTKRICIKCALIDVSNGLRGLESFSCANESAPATNFIIDSDGSFITDTDGSFILTS